MSPSLASPSELPPWLRRRARPRGAGGARLAPPRSALVLFAAGVGAGFLYARRGDAVAAPPPPPPQVCPPASSARPPAGGRRDRARARHAAIKRSKPAPAALSPLPDTVTARRRQRGRRRCARSPKRRRPSCATASPNPTAAPRSSSGRRSRSVRTAPSTSCRSWARTDPPKDVKRCYANRLKHWRFPEELLRGEEKLLVNFVL